MTTGVRERDQIAKQWTWNAESVFATPEAWEAEFKALGGDFAKLAGYQGQMANGPSVLLSAVELVQELFARAWKLYAYGYMSHAVDTRQPAAAQMQSRAEGIYAQALAAAAFLQPELISIGEPNLRNWMEQEPRLKLYDHFINDLFRKQQHVRSAEVEELLGMVEDPFQGIRATAGLLVDADVTFRPARSSEGEDVPVNQGSMDKILHGPDREARRTAWESYADTYLAYKNTLASNLTTSVRANVFQMRARRHASTLALTLFKDNIPEQVFHNLIDTFRKHVGTWHRYWAVRRAALRVDELHPYDVWAPLTKNPPTLTYEQAVNWVSEGLAPLGAEYVETLRRGCLELRWVDVYPNLGKRQGAFSAGAPGTYPFIMMSFTDDVSALSTLAHELGHSMHSYLAWKHQPVIYSEYSLFAAEVASNFHQAMVRAHILASTTDVALQISIIEDAMDNFHRYFLIMPTLARFELEAHQRVERGDGFSADGLISLMADLFQEPYGKEMHLDRNRVGITWAQFLHLYQDYYVFQYATGISGAHALSAQILAGESGAVEAYLGFLKAGASVYPLDALRAAGVDLSSPEPVEQTFKILDDLVERLAKLVGVSERVG